MLVVAATDVGILLIAAGSAVVGAAIAGAVSGGFSLRSDHNRRAREDQQELKLAKGAARQLRATLRQSREQDARIARAPRMVAGVRDHANVVGRVALRTRATGAQHRVSALSSG